MLVRRFSQNKEGRDIAVGDVHGHFTLLFEALQKIHFNPDVDRLFSTGDLVDRGPENTLALDWVRKPWFYPVRGNHDDKICRYETAQLGSWPDEMGKWFYELPEDTQAEWAREFRKIPIIHEVETPAGLVGIVHAECVLPSWRELKKELLHPVDNKRLKLIKNCCMFSRRRWELKEDHVIEDVHAVVVGHEPMNEVGRLGNVHYIDTYGWRPKTGHFTLYDLHTLQPIT